MRSPCVAALPIAAGKGRARRFRAAVSPWAWQLLTPFSSPDLADRGVNRWRRLIPNPFKEAMIMATATSSRMPTQQQQHPQQQQQHPQHQQEQPRREEHSEGTIARMIEQQTAKLPSDLFLWAAGGSIAASLILQFAGRKHESLFVGQWAPTLLILGLYNKLVKLAGSDPATR